VQYLFQLPTVPLHLHIAKFHPQLLPGKPITYLDTLSVYGFSTSKPDDTLPNNAKDFIARFILEGIPASRATRTHTYRERGVWKAGCGMPCYPNPLLLFSSAYEANALQHHWGAAFGRLESPQTTREFFENVTLEGRFESLKATLVERDAQLADARTVPSTQVALLINENLSLKGGQAVGIETRIG